jgi:hypothetical protein
MITQRYQPKGSMCATCESKNADCSHLDFSKMKQLGGYLLESEVIRIVKCKAFKRDKQ